MKKKILALCLVAVLAATAVIGGTMAYFTDVTEEKVNTFTIGKVDIDLTEPDWDPDGDHRLVPDTGYAKNPTITVQEGSEDSWLFMEVKMNKFNAWLSLVAMLNDSETLNLIDYTEDCTAAACTEAGHCQGHLNAEGLTQFFATGSYQEALDQWFGGADHENWKIMNWDEVWASVQASWNDPSVQVVNPIFGYKSIKSAGDSVTLFTSVNMPAEVTSAMLANAHFDTEEEEWELTLKAYAIQAVGVDSLQAAYEGLFVNL